MEPIEKNIQVKSGGNRLSPTEDTILNVSDLSVRFCTRRGEVEALRDISFGLKKEQVLGIVGESGSGKSVLALSILNLVEKPGEILSGRIFFKGTELLGLKSKAINKIRGGRISMIFSDPMSAFDPTLTVGSQIIETIQRHHRGVGRKRAREMGIELFRKVKIPSPVRRMDEYPSMFSGGMIQRAMIADALSSNPELIIADNPTQALDVTIQCQILELLADLKKNQGTALVLITNSLPILARYADEIMVLYAGEIVEHGDRRSLLTRPCHPYTRGLIDSTPRISRKRLKRLKTIEGFTPSRIRADAEQARCVFLERCRLAVDACHNLRPDQASVNTGRRHYARCFLASELAQAPL